MEALIKLVATMNASKSHLWFLLLGVLLVLIGTVRFKWFSVPVQGRRVLNTVGIALLLTAGFLLVWYEVLKVG